MCDILITIQSNKKIDGKLQEKICSAKTNIVHITEINIMVYIKKTSSSWWGQSCTDNCQILVTALQEENLKIVCPSFCASVFCPTSQVYGVIGFLGNQVRSQVECSPDHAHAVSGTLCETSCLLKTVHRGMLKLSGIQFEGHQVCLADYQIRFLTMLTGDWFHDKVQNQKKRCHKSEVRRERALEIWHV